jgi:imidazolonepropionase-like amidohydrolase
MRTNGSGDGEKDSQDDGKEEDDLSPPARDLRLEALASVLRSELPLLVTANRAQDIATALRLAGEFRIRIWLDGAAESYLMVDQIKAAGIPVFIHPSMVRAVGEYENLSFETAGKLVTAGIPVIMQSGFEGYVPKTRVVLFEAALTAANGLTFEQALATVTSDAAKVLGIDDRVGTLEPGKDADLALYDGDPFEYTTHCVGVIINGKVVSEIKR